MYGLCARQIAREMIAIESYDEVCWKSQKDNSLDVSGICYEGFDWRYDRAEPAVSYRWRRNNWLKFKTAGKLAIIFEEFIEHTPIL